MVGVVPGGPGSDRMGGGGEGPSRSGLHGDLFHPLLGGSQMGLFFALSWFCGFQQVPPAGGGSGW